MNANSKDSLIVATNGHASNLDRELLSSSTKSLLELTVDHSFDLIPPLVRDNSISTLNFTLPQRHHSLHDCDAEELWGDELPPSIEEKNVMQAAERGQSSFGITSRIRRFQNINTKAGQSSRYSNFRYTNRVLQCHP